MDLNHLKGGCLLAMSCEYRVMLPKFTIGLNETQLGIVAPTWFQGMKVFFYLHNFYILLNE